MYLSLVLLFLFIILMTGSRGALLGLVIAVLVYLFQIKALFNTKILVSTVVIVLLVWFVIIPIVPNALIYRYINFNEYLNTGGSGRIKIWQITINNVIPDMGLLGVGTNCAPLSLSPYVGYNRAVHNTYLRMIVEYSIFGIPAFIAMLMSKLHYLSKRKAYINYALLIAIIVIIFFLDSYTKKYFWNVVMLASIYEASQMKTHQS